MSIEFTRDEWAGLARSSRQVLSERDVADLHAIDPALALDEVVDVFVPLARLLDLHIAAALSLHRTTSEFLARQVARRPYLIGIAGGVAAGKTTAARVLEVLLGQGGRRTVERVATDAFLHPNAELQRRGLTHRKGFPESYDLAGLVRFLAGARSGPPTLSVPQYSHVVYDVLADAVTVASPDVLVVEGLNVLQGVAELLDFTIYLDAEPHLLRQWYATRFVALRDAAAGDPAAYFHRYAELTDAETSREIARRWDGINEPNLVEHIAPTKARAHLVLRKGQGHRVTRVLLRPT